MPKLPPPENPAPVPPPPCTKRYAEAFKRQAVEHWLRSSQPGTQIASELGVSYRSLKDWKARYHGEATPVCPELLAENRALKAELARVREQRDILKKRWASSPNRRRALPAH